jgi:flagellar motor switch protein FliN/FliY
MTMINQSDKTAVADDPKVAEAPGRISSKLIDNVGVTLDAFLGEAPMTVADFTSLKQGSVVPLDVPFNQAVELRLNGVPVARGELVAVGEKFGVRLVEISK